MPFLQIAVFDATRAERDDGDDDRLLYQEHFRVHDRPEHCTIMSDLKPTDLTGWFLGLSSLAPHFGASDKSALRFVCSEKAICATLNPCEEVWIAAAFIYGSPLSAVSSSSSSSSGDSAADNNNFASQVFRDVNPSSIANFFRSHLRALENLLRSVCGSPPLWGGPIMIPKAMRKEMLKNGQDLRVETDDIRELPANPEKFRHVCDLFGCHLATLIGSMHQSVKKGSDACSTFFGFPTIRSSVKIALGTGGRAKISQISDGTNIPVVMLIDGMLAISATTDDIARNLVLVNNLFPSQLKEGSIFFSAPRDDESRREMKSELLEKLNKKELHPGLFNPDGKPDAWKVVRCETMYQGIQHLAIGLVPLDVYNDVEKSTPILRDLRDVIADLVLRSRELTNAQSVVSYKNAPRFRFKDPSLQFSWSSPGYGSGSSTLFGNSNNNSSSSGTGSSSTSSSSNNQNNNVDTFNNNSTTNSPQSSTRTSAANYNNNNYRINNNSAASSSSMPLAKRSNVSSMNQKTHYDFSLNAEKGNNNTQTNNAILSPRLEHANRGVLTSPSHGQQQKNINSSGNNNQQPFSSPAPPTSSSSSPSLASNSTSRQALIPLLRACCTLTCQMATLTERAIDNKVGSMSTNEQHHQETATPSKINPMFKLGIPETMKPFTFDDYFSSGPNIFVNDDDLVSPERRSKRTTATSSEQKNNNNNRKNDDGEDERTTNTGSSSSTTTNEETLSQKLHRLEQPEDRNWMAPIPDVNSKWFSKDDLTYKVDDYSWATIKVIGGRAVGIMVLCSEPNAQTDSMSIEELIHQSNAVSLLTFDEVWNTTYDQS